MTADLSRDIYADPVAAAEVAAEGVRALNHATIWDGYPNAADLSSVLASLQAMAEGLPQALDQAAGWLSRVRVEGRLRDDREDLGGGLDLSVAVVEVTQALDQARTAAEALAVALARAGRDACHLSGGGS